jgi:hypothetical protein
MSAFSALLLLGFVGALIIRFWAAAFLSGAFLVPVAVWLKTLLVLGWPDHRLSTAVRSITHPSRVQSALLELGIGVLLALSVVFAMRTPVGFALATLILLASLIESALAAKGKSWLWRNHKEG